MQNRVDIKNYIIEIEKKLPINNWKVNGIHIWPIIRIRLYFFLIKKIETFEPIKKENFQTEKTKKNYFGNKIGQFKDIFNFLFWFIKLPKKKFIFLGGDVHRVSYSNKRYNRFFYPLIESYSL
jgi:hypothetical protein